MFELNETTLYLLLLFLFVSVIANLYFLMNNPYLSELNYLRNEINKLTESPL